MEIKLKRRNKEAEILHKKSKMVSFVVVVGVSIRPNRMYA
jgi:hypothetical protein